MVSGSASVALTMAAELGSRIRYGAPVGAVEIGSGERRR